MTRDTRRSLLAKLHCAKRDLGLDDDAYRDVLEQVCGARSAKDLTVPQLARALNHFTAKGWKGPKQAAQGGFIEIPDTDPNARQKRFILGMWKALGWKLAGVKTRLERQFGVSDIRWLHDQQALQTLGRDLEKRCRKRGIDVESLKS